MTNNELITIESANATFDAFNARRFGITACNASLDYEYLNDLREIYERSIDLESCEGELDNCCGCDMATVNERIQTL